MKVLHVLEYSRPNISGYSSRSDAIIKHQRRAGIDTCQMTSQRYQDFEQELEHADGLDYYRTQSSKSLLSKIPLVSYIDYILHLSRRIEFVVEREQPELIQAHSPMFNGFAASIVARKFNIPVAYEVRALWEDAAVDTGKAKEGGVRYRIIRAVEQMVFKRVNSVSCICEGLRSEVVSRGIDAGKVFVTPNAVDIENFTQSFVKDGQLEQELGLGDKKVLAFIGSFFKYEGLQLAIEACALLKQQRSDIHLLLVGSGNDEPTLKRLVKELNIDEMVTFTGRVSFEHVQRYYSLADVMVFPRESIRLTELVTPLKPLESMAQGIPVIASDIGGHRELIEHNHNGLLFEHGNAEALATTVLDLIDNSNLTEKLISNGLSYVKKTRNWDNTGKVYLPVYQTLISELTHVK
ncbi:TIGR04063 family PEP-CTERM/XrtA system glycosyltransferase [Agarivorans gilvus]|uniref:Glycoside hydrolase n=1 Tax=Agarivorans gilvus TaxID=680279 RepID=A0ABQ1I2T9_9ALTE|nr:TIGR04063 family PEP-CTERM/XrtA system glycosyltransferase [Agarivorans gilvus]GGB08835.1 glycoside hydrolase [Agarivorans gilvus]